MKKFFLVVFSLIALVTVAGLAAFMSGSITIPGKGESDPIGPYFIVVVHDYLGTPIRCEKYTRDIRPRWSTGGTVDYYPGDGAHVYRPAASTMIIKLDLLTEMAESDMYETLGMTAETCERVQERRFDPESDTYMTGSEKAEQGEYMDPPQDLPPDADGL